MKLEYRIKVLGISLLGLSFFQSSYAQQDPQYTQYMYDHANVNPAYAGSTGTFDIFGMYRTQWIGLDGAPKTATLSGTSPIGTTGLGIGFHFTNDQIGAMDENNISVDLSYVINLNYDYRLSFGLKGTGNLLDVNYSKLQIHNPSDPSTHENINNDFSLNMGAGVFFYSDNAYVGLSVPKLFTETRYSNNDVKTMREKMHLYLTAGYVFDLTPDWQLKPAALVKTVEGSPLQVDVSANALFKEKYTIGLGYRWDASVSLLAGYQIRHNMFIGYSYDTDTSSLSNHNSGSHEIFMRFNLFNNTRGSSSPRFF